MIRRAVARGFGSRRLQPLKRALLHRQVRFEIHMRCRCALVAEPQGDHADIHPRLEKVHRGRVPDRVRRYRAAGELRAGRGSGGHCERQALGDA